MTCFAAFALSSSSTAELRTCAQYAGCTAARRDIGTSNPTSSALGNGMIIASSAGGSVAAVGAAPALSPGCRSAAGMLPSSPATATSSPTCSGTTAGRRTVVTCLDGNWSVSFSTVSAIERSFLTASSTCWSSGDSICAGAPVSISAAKPRSSCCARRISSSASSDTCSRLRKSMK